MSLSAPVRHLLTSLGTWTSHPGAFVVVSVYAAAWLAFDHEQFDFHSGATLATWFMTLLIQRVSHRDTQALHAKLDEILKAHGGADEGLAHLDEREPEEIEGHRDATLNRDEGVRGA